MISFFIQEESTDYKKNYIKTPTNRFLKFGGGDNKFAIFNITKYIIYLITVQYAYFNHSSTCQAIYTTPLRMFVSYQSSNTPLFVTRWHQLTASLCLVNALLHQNVKMSPIHCQMECAFLLFLIPISCLFILLVDFQVLQENRLLTILLLTLLLVHYMTKNIFVH